MEVFKNWSVVPDWADSIGFLSLSSPCQHFFFCFPKERWIRYTPPLKSRPLFHLPVYFFDFPFLSVSLVWVESPTLSSRLFFFFFRSAIQYLSRFSIVWTHTHTHTHLARTRAQQETTIFVFVLFELKVKILKERKEKGKKRERVPFAQTMSSRRLWRKDWNYSAGFSVFVRCN